VAAHPYHLLPMEISRRLAHKNNWTTMSWVLRWKQAKIFFPRTFYVKFVPSLEWDMCSSDHPPSNNKMQKMCVKMFESDKNTKNWTVCRGIESAIHKFQFLNGIIKFDNFTDTWSSINSSSQTILKFANWSEIIFLEKKEKTWKMQYFSTNITIFSNYR
jgi:hypothetical protein